MNHRSILFTIIILTAFAFLSCGKSTPVNPTTPPTPPAPPNITSAQTSTSSGHQLWGLWQGVYNAELNNFELIQKRTAEFHVNLTGKLQPPFADGLAVSINEFDKAAGYVDLDLTIKHPFPSTDFRGFDVRGIVMGSGTTIPSKVDPAVTYAAPDGLRLLNADGYTRWWNALEFTDPGLYGFEPGDLGMGFFVPLGTLHAYKMFSDPLDPEDSVVPLVNISNRGTFSTDLITSSLIRNYQIQFPIGGTGNPNWLFQYAIDASFNWPTGVNPPPKPVSDYPLEANSPEAFHIEVDTTGTTAYYAGGSNFGGDVVLAIEVFDWGAMVNPIGILGEVESVWIESDTLFDSAINVTSLPYGGSQTTSGIYTITIPDVHPTGLTSQEILITVRSSDPTTYAPPIPGAAYPAGAALAAYKIIEIPISNLGPQDDYLTVDDPNGGEHWVIGETELIEWTSVGEVGTEVKIEYSVDDGTPISIIAGTNNDGSFPWNPIPDVESEDVKVIITSITYPEIWDDSDNYFKISAEQPDKSLTMTSPDGGEDITGGGSWTIKWDSMGPIVNVKLDLSTNGGLAYDTEITVSTADDGIFLWNPVPSINSSNCKIKVTDVDDGTVYDASNSTFTITTGAVSPGWNPVAGKTQIALTSPVPDQYEFPTDIAVFSGGSANQSHGEIVDQTDNTFYKYNDTYTDVTGTEWQHELEDIGAIHKFDVLPDGSQLFVTYADDTAWEPPGINDPGYCIMSSNNNSTGTGNYLFFGDSGDPDPDSVTWWWIVDFSCGVPDGVNDTTGYQVMVQSPDSPVAHNGSIAIIYWGAPYDNSSIGGLFFNASTQGGGTGYIDDTNPGAMAVAVDDNSGLTIDGTHPSPAYWILDSTGEAQSMLAGWQASSIVMIDNRIDNEEISDPIVDLEIANAKDFGYSVSETADFNWICCLIDEGGMWKVGVWECDYLANDGDHAELHEIDITNSLPGDPMSLDFDPVDFEIHVLADNEGIIEATVFNFTP